MLIKMSTKSMAEGVTGKPFFPAKFKFMSMDVPGKKKSINGFVRIFMILLGEKPVHRSVISKPVLCQQIKSHVRKNGITIITGFGMLDMNAHIFPVNIFIVQTTDFTYAKPS